jgi:FkbM family methyltransferase
MTRALEAAHLLARFAADFRTRAVLISCYASLRTTTTSAEPVDLRLRLGGRVVPLHMRKSDIFTLGEILHEGQYRLVSRLPDSPVIFDAGANVGVSALWFLAQHPGAQLHCFEPEAENFRLLEANLGGRRNVRLTRAALGTRSGEALLHVAEHGAMHSVVDAGAGGRAQRVPQLELREYVESQGVERIDLLKIDVEGSELDLLLGLGDRIERVAVVVGELHERLVDAVAFYGLLERHGFRVLQRRPAGGEEGVELFEAGAAGR